jgi:hypothetical protein
MRTAILIAIALWFIFGNAPMNIADMFWEEEAAPWETVDAFYYPDRNDLTQFQQTTDLDSVDDCRAWVSSAAALNGDPSLFRGDYECGIEVVDSLGSISVYRNTVR